MARLLNRREILDGLALLIQAETHSRQRVEAEVARRTEAGESCEDINGLRVQAAFNLAVLSSARARIAGN